jgi:hypothetical protein
MQQLYALIIIVLVYAKKKIAEIFAGTKFNV